MSAAVRPLRAAPALAPEPGPEAEQPTGDPRLSWAAAAVGPALQALRREFDRDDWTGLIGLLLLAAGLWIWVGLGPALTAVGALTLALAVGGARAAAAAAVPEAKAEPGGGG